MTKESVEAFKNAYYNGHKIINTGDILGCIACKADDSEIRKGLPCPTL